MTPITGSRLRRCVHEKRPSKRAYFNMAFGRNDCCTGARSVNWQKSITGGSHTWPLCSKAFSVKLLPAAFRVAPGAPMFCHSARTCQAPRCGRDIMRFAPARPGQPEAAERVRLRRSTCALRGVLQTVRSNPDGINNLHLASPLNSGRGTVHARVIQAA